MGLGDFRGGPEILATKKGGPGVIAELWRGALKF